MPSEGLAQHVDRARRLGRPGAFSRLGMKSVQAKFLAHVLPLVLISTVVVFGAFEFKARRSAEEQLARKLERLVAIQGAVIAEPMWNVAEAQVELILAALTTDRDVIGAAVYDERGAPVASAGAVDGLDQEQYFASVPLIFDATPIGRLDLALTDARLQALARDRLLLASALAAILLIAVIGAAIVANRRTIGRPLAMLVDSITRSKDDGPRVAVEWRSDDEIGRLVLAFNDMQERQDAYEGRLRASRDELEQRVQDRTAKLAAAEAAAQKLRDQLTDAIESISEGFALFDREDRLLVANRRYREIMLGDGHTPFAAGMTFRELVEQAAVSGRFPNAAADPQAWVDRQLDRHREFAKPFIQELANDSWQRFSNRLTDEGGIVAVHSDITEIMRISDELKRAKDAAEAANAAKSAFLATMSHEIRTPLNGIVGMSMLLNGTELNDEQREFSQTIVTAADTLLTIINDILDFSKVEAGALELERIPVDLAEVTESSMELIGSRADEKGIELACRIDADVPAGLYGDPTRLKQILLNLLNNAVKFTERGEVVLTVSSAAPATSRIPGETTLLRFSVRDTGIGIPRDRIGRLFRSFSQVDASTTRRYGGTGLGLVITKRLVELMGGEIQVDSEPGQGTTFSFTLPAEVAALSNQSSRSSQLALLKGRHVLVVDDNRTNRLILTEKLRAWELQAVAASSAEEALEKLGGPEPVDVCVIDFKMPRMNGIELARRIRRAGAPHAPSLILFTSVSLVDPDFRSRAREAGFQSVLTKPTRSSSLLKALTDAVAPEHGDAPDKPAAAVPELSPELARLSILLVDDNAINRQVAKKILKRLGYVPEVVSSGAQAIEACSKTSFDAVLMDIEMPEMDGITAAARIREQAGDRPRPFIVALTANAMASERENYLRSGMDDYLSKPIDVDALSRSLRAAAEFRVTGGMPGTACPERSS